MYSYDYNGETFSTYISGVPTVSLEFIHSDGTTLLVVDSVDTVNKILTVSEVV